MFASPPAELILPRAAVCWHCCVVLVAVGHHPRILLGGPQLIDHARGVTRGRKQYPLDTGGLQFELHDDGVNAS